MPLVTSFPIGYPDLQDKATDPRSKPGEPDPVGLFYHINKDRITMIVAALIMDPDPRRAVCSTEHLVDTAAAIVSEIARRAGDTYLLPEETTGHPQHEQFDAMA